MGGTEKVLKQGLSNLGALGGYPGLQKGLGVKGIWGR